MAPKSRPPSPVAGVFKPAVPKSPDEVLLLYAIATRVVVLDPDSVGKVTTRIAAVCSSLVPPESSVAAECGRLWLMFTRLMRAGTPQTREHSGRAFVRDLDNVGQKLELPPMRGWDGLPQGVDDPNAPTLEVSEVTSPGETLGAMKVRAKKRKADGSPVTPDELGQAIRGLFAGDRDELFKQLIGGGTISRSDAHLLVRWLAKGEKLGKDDEALIEVLEGLGKWLTR